MIELSLAIQVDHMSTTAYGTRIELIQCEHYEIENGAITFYRMRFFGGANNPNEYFASFMFPLHRVEWLQKKFGAGKTLPNYNGKVSE